MSTRCITLSLAGILITLAGCESAQPSVSWQDGDPVFESARGERTFHRYRYHPNAKVYYEPFNQRYYWFQDGAWRSGTTIPTELDALIEPRLSTTIDLEQELPFLHHESVRAKHPSRRPIPTRFDPDAAMPSVVAGVDTDS
ncbi:MAG: hypothetical protein HKO59_17965 [Phycisphaerales bacterium]|nr:hypothetical protein [Phycisphaerae bacterium]NNF44266.1 hypothetical protein [Phycisphaerales bacterium]NNM27826.1 hypothetical protein [Phycisphaerales bacterium]